LECPKFFVQNWSEVQLQAELDEPRSGVACDLSERAGAQCRARIVQHDVVKGVEHFGAELQSHLAFIEREVLENRQIQILRARPAQDAAAGAAEGRRR